MKRTTISLPNNVAEALHREARRSGVPVSRIAREAIEARLRLSAEGKRRKFSFVGIGHSGERTISEDVEEILTTEWGRAGDR
jgi:hypothetical protein